MAITFENEKFEKAVAGSTATISYNDKNAFNVGNVVSKKDTIEVFKHSGEYISEATTFATNIALEEFKANKDIDDAIITYPYGPTGSGEVAIKISREKKFKNPSNGEEIKRPDIRVAVKHSMMKPSKSHVQSLQKHMLESLAD